MEGKFLTNEIRNAEGVWINSNVFKEEGNFFMKNGYYCPDPKDSPSFINYWDDQLERCTNGYSVGGVKITQHHYFYLNFTQISVAEETGGKTAVKKMKMPDFWDGDYAFFWAIEIAKNGLFTEEALAPSTLEERAEYFNPATSFERMVELENRVLKRLNLPFKIDQQWLDGGHNLIVGKSRRKGYSYKNAAICANIYNTIRNSLTIIGAFDKKYLYPKGTMGMTSAYLSFLNKNTAWAKGREYVDKQEHKRASFSETNTQGVKIEAGYLSEVMAITFKDNPEAARGKDAKIVLLEEAGAFPNLKDAYRKTAPGLTAGKYITGQIIIFGTGGDMESGTIDFADMFYHPKEDNLMPFVNIWDEDADNSTCGFFHPVTWNMEGHYDKQGNSDIQGAKEEENNTRKKIIQDSTSSGAIQQRVQEWPFNPAEAFLTVSINDFPVMELRNQYNKVIRENLYLKFGQPVHLIRQELNEQDSYDERGVLKRGRKYKIVAQPDLEGIIEPLWSYKPKTKNLNGGVVIYEYPVENPPKGLYKIGFDPYRQQSSSMTLPSLASVYVYKARHRLSATRDTIVAQYVGRPYSPDDVNRYVEMLAELYGAEIMYENEVTHVKDYFIRRKKVHLLAAQPDTVISKLVFNSQANRVYGIHMVDKIKDGGEKYIKQWLLEGRDYDGDGKAILNLETIYDPALLEELILYNRKGNFDRVMAFMMVMLQLADEEEAKEYGDNKNTNATDLLQMMKTQFSKRHTNLQG